MTVGELAKASGVSAKMIRHYESINLISKAKRNESGYRVYSEKDVNTLSFIKSARDLGFPLSEIKTLLGLWKNKRRSSAQVKRLAQNHIDQLQQKINELEKMRKTLNHLVRHCHGDDRPDCPIIDALDS